MAKINDLIIDLEQQGKIYYDEHRRQYYPNREGRATARGEAQNESGVPSEEHSGNDDFNGGWRQLFPPCPRSREEDVHFKINALQALRERG